MPPFPAGRLSRGLWGSCQVPGPVRRVVRPAGRTAAAAAVAAAAPAAGPLVSPLHGYPGLSQRSPSYPSCLIFLRSSRTATEHPLGVDDHPLQLPLSWRRPGRTRPPPPLPLPPAPPRLFPCLSHKHPPCLFTQDHLPTLPQPGDLFIPRPHSIFYFLSAPLSPSSISNLTKFPLFSFPFSIFSRFLSLYLPNQPSSYSILSSESLLLQVVGSHLIPVFPLFSTYKNLFLSISPLVTIKIFFQIISIFLSVETF